MHHVNYFWGNLEAGYMGYGTKISTCKKIPLQKSNEFGMTLKYSATRYKQKTEIFRIIRPLTCWKPDYCFWFVRKDKKRI